MHRHTTPRRLLTTLGTTLFTGILCCTPSVGQSLRFTPVTYTVDSLNNMLNHPGPVAVDPAGNVYLGDSALGEIFKVDPNGTESIFAGRGISFHGGDGGLAVNAYLSGPGAIAADAAGNVYLSDFYASSVRRVDKNGIITTYAGGNGAGSTGDGGQATAAQITPDGLACDSYGNLYFIDGTSKTLRMVNTSGVISTVAGAGTPASGNGDGGPASSAKFGSPNALAIDPTGNIYVGDGVTVRKIDLSGNISTAAGNGNSGYTGDNGPATSAQFNSITAIAVDALGDLYITDFTSFAVRMVNAGGVISTMNKPSSFYGAYDGGPTDQVYIGTPYGIAVDSNANLYVTSYTGNALIQIVQHPERFPQTKLGQTTRTQRLIVENYGASPITFSSLTFSGDFAKGTTFLTNGNDCQGTSAIYPGAEPYCTLDVVFTPTAEGIRSFPLTITSDDTPGTLTETLTSTGLGSALSMTSNQMFIVAGVKGPFGTRGEGGPATSASLNGLLGVTADSSGNLYFSEGSYCQIRRVDAATGTLTTIAGVGDPTSCDNEFHTSHGDGGLATAAYTPGVGPMAMDASNNLYFADPYDSSVRKIQTTGSKFISTYAGAGLGYGNTYACAYSGDGGPAISAQMCSPFGIAFDASGNLYIADTGNNVIRKVTPGALGTITTVAGNYTKGQGYSGDGGAATSAQLNQPYAVAVNGAGDIFIADTYNQVIRKVSAATGLISTIAGNFRSIQAGYSGDGGPAASALLNYPKGLATDVAGDLFFADSQNYVLRKIDLNGDISTVAGNSQFRNGYTGDYLPATATGIGQPNFLSVSASGYVFAIDTTEQLIREMTPNGALTFPTQKVGTTGSTQVIQVSNVGNVPMVFDSLQPTGITGDFALNGGSSTTCVFTQPLPAGSSCNVGITFTPVAGGERTGIFAFYDNGVAEPQFVSLLGTGDAHQSQTITITHIADHVYGDAPFTVSASTTSNLPITYSILSGNASVSGSAVTITGTGQVVVAADQAGNELWSPATEATQVFNVSPAALTVTAQAEQTPYGDALATLAYTYSTFAYGETASVLGGTPAVTTTATPTSDPGTFPISIAAGSLVSANYTFTFVPAVYTITKASQSIIFSESQPTAIYGGSPLTPNLIVSSHLPVTLSIVSGPATVTGTAVTFTGVGAVVVAADQAGNADYTAASQAQHTYHAKSLPGLSWSPTITTFFTGNKIPAGFFNATASAPGTLAYSLNGSPIDATTVLPSGLYSPIVTFTPTDPTLYLPDTFQASLTVQNQNIFFLTANGTAGYLDNTGATQNSGSSGGGIGAAIDASGNLWSINTNGMGVTSFDDSGSPQALITPPGIHGATALAIDGYGIVWITNSNGTISSISSFGGYVPSTAVGGAGNLSAPSSISVDFAGNLWISNSGNNTVTEIIGLAGPAVTPTVTAVTNKSLGQEP